MTNPLHVIVIGAGIGGLGLAQGLRKTGVAVEVYERDRHPGSRMEGHRLHIDPSGSTATAVNDLLSDAIRNWLSGVMP